MTEAPEQSQYTTLQTIGTLVFVVLCGLPALEMNGFGFGIPLTLSTGLLCATVGGAVGGMMVHPKPLVAGLVGGLIAGPLGLLAVYFYTQQRETVWNLELILAQGIGCLPGIAAGYLLSRWLTKFDADDAFEQEAEKTPEV